MRMMGDSTPGKNSGIPAFRWVLSGRRPSQDPVRKNRTVILSGQFKVCHVTADNLSCIQTDALCDDVANPKWPTHGHCA